MFRSRTLLIVGAGASCEAELPSGAELLRRIASAIDIRFSDIDRRESGDPEIVQALRNHVRNPNGRRGDINPYLRAGRRVCEAASQALSIDNVLDAHQDDDKVELCGKLGIVKTILDAESKSKLQITSGRTDQIDFNVIQETWYIKLSQLLTEGIAKKDVERIFENLSIITFNYDRCIEHFLIHSLSSYYGIEIQRAQSLVAELKIYHPYGMVGQLPWQQAGDLSVPYGGSYTTDLLSVASSIKTFTERLEDNDVLHEMRDEVRMADRLVFLGLGFHRQNMELLRLDEEAQARSVFATTMGISKSDCKVVRSQIVKTLRRSSKDLPIELADMKCAKLFDEYWRSLTD